MQWIAVLSLPANAQQVSPAPAYDGQLVQSVDVDGVSPSDRQHLLDLLPQKSGSPLQRDQVRESIRVLYGTGRFADIEAEVSPVSQGVQLKFVTSPNFFVGSIEVQGASSRPTANQI